MKIRAFVSVAALALVLLAVPAMAADGNLARVAINGNAIDWQPMTQNGFELAVTGPNGFHFQDTFRSSDVPSLSGLEDGQYRYEIRALAELQHRNIVRDNDQGLTANTRGETQSGYFRVVGGAVMRQDTQEEANAPAPAAPQGGLQNAPAADQVILDDLIVDGSACIGMDCVNGESFGFDTLRLKENNLRIKAQDTSNSASFPSNDWQITFNDSSNGGANKFSIDDIDGGRTPFTIEAGAPSNSLYVDDGGRVGLGKSTPVVELHIVDGDSPTIRLEQDGSSGFTAQTWDLAGNEANFFVRDVTNASKLPFKVFPNAPTNALTIEGTTGDIGVGTQSPAASIHVVRSNETANILVDENNGTAAARTLMQLENNGSVRLELIRSDVNATWQITHAANFLINDPDVAGTEFSLDSSGNLEIAGGLTTAMNNLPDYVFEDDYQLMPMDELEQFITANRHLPNLPSAAKVAETGQVNLTEMHRLLLEKVEELTLYTLQQQDAIEELRVQNTELKTLLEASK
jgi:hypothetical protein